MRTDICDALGIDLPIFAFSHCRDVVAAVSRAGGLGVLGAVAYTPEQLEIELGWIDDQLADRPYGVDVLIPAKYVGLEKGGLSSTEAAGAVPAGHRQFVADLLARYGVPPLPSSAPTRQGRPVLGPSHEGARRLLDVVWAHPKVRLVANALGPAPEYLVTAAHDRGLLVGGLVGK